MPKKTSTDWGIGTLLMCVTHPGPQSIMQNFWCAQFTRFPIVLWGKVLVFCLPDKEKKYKSVDFGDFQQFLR
jgi:hypothetical protein